MIVFEKGKRFRYSDYTGDVLSLLDFIGMVMEESIIPSDGIIGDVIVDGHETNIVIPDWWGLGIRDNDVKLKLFQLDLIDGDVEIGWCNK
jgi:hypothetical protein